MCEEELSTFQNEEVVLIKTVKPELFWMAVGATEVVDISGREGLPARTSLLTESHDPVSRDFLLSIAKTVEKMLSGVDLIRTQGVRHGVDDCRLHQLHLPGCVACLHSVLNQDTAP